MGFRTHEGRTTNALAQTVLTLAMERKPRFPVRTVPPCAEIERGERSPYPPDSRPATHAFRVDDHCQAISHERLVSGHYAETECPTSKGACKNSPMPQARSVRLLLRSEFTLVDGTVRSWTWKWLVYDSNAFVVQEGERLFGTLCECVDDAREYGYVTPEKR